MHYDAYLFHEEDLYNLVNTGRQWFGESLALIIYSLLILLSIIGTWTHYCLVLD